MAVERLAVAGAKVGKKYIYVFAPLARIAEAREAFGKTEGVRFLNSERYSEASLPRDASRLYVLDGSHHQAEIVRAGAKVLKVESGGDAESPPPKARKRRVKADAV